MKILLLASQLVLAVVLGIFGQDMAYFVHKNVYASHPIYYLTFFTIVSIILFITTLVSALRFRKHKKTTKQVYEVFVGATLLLGFITCIWSVFVTLMWWG